MSGYGTIVIYENDISIYYMGDYQISLDMDIIGMYNFHVSDIYEKLDNKTLMKPMWFCIETVKVNQ